MTDRQIFDSAVSRLATVLLSSIVVCGDLLVQLKQTYLPSVSMIDLEFRISLFDILINY